ncbi:G-nucleotide exchange factor SopE [Salmonella enterica subsp. enterica serovar Adelaide str. A4-669]|uniref:G-nucleotide exchange factor SopE n=1 Tax=Salmonella enterica subsp. enterica serovar Adelaide str. A4-669 TaxID=913063 RepID=A0A6C8GQF3_SALET|nr:G-nucleotide exchange factor SopE [Salmonella enterica subsp. enterica serovar Adelaide str. A4-669]
MTNITLSTQHYRIHRSDVEPVKEKTTEKDIFAKSNTRRRTFLQKVFCKKYYCR